MLKLFLMLRGFVRRFPGDDWRRDPLAHPDIARMDARMLADLPIDSGTILPE
ncbi:hypothetical protein M8R20_01860 [Pseudomonas sp. R2.Fl]|nr:hypothetical protein [Pseudomonas sp. R2.Fl]